MKLKLSLITPVLLLVSVSAFAAGFLQSDMETNVFELKQLRIELEASLSRMEEKANSIYIHDIADNNEAIRYFLQADDQDIAFDLLYDNISEEEKEVYRLTILSNIGRYAGYQGLLAPIKMYKHFINSTADYVITSKSGEGFDYNISKAVFDLYNPAENHSAIEVYGDFRRFSELVVHPIAPQFVIEFTGNLSELLFHPVNSLQGRVQALSLQIDSLEGQVNQIQLGVSLTTMAAILAAAMGNRINEHELSHDLSIIQSNVSKDPVKIKSGSDFMSITALFIAAIVSLLGLIIPLILRT